MNLYKLLNRIERMTAKFQGKGYGTASIAQEVKLVHQLLQSRPKIALDIGGNIGDYTAELKRVTNDLEVHVFEPASVNVVKLKDRYGSDGLVVINQVALSDTAEKAVLYSDEPGSGLGSLTKRNLQHFDILFEVNEPVEKIRFEDYWSHTLGRRAVDIAKIDVEGHELSVLMGFGEALGCTRLIQFEFGGANIDTRTYFQDFWYFFKHHNFDIFRISPIGLHKVLRYSEVDEFFSTTNYLARNKTLRC